MSTAQRLKPRFRVGDWVSMSYGVRRVWAQIIEDRGPLGVNRRRLYRIRIDDDSGEPITTEVPEVDLTPVELDRRDVVDYLKGGGLVDILRSNLGGGHEEPKAWLTVDQRGNLIHTLDAGRGLLGGETVPFFALQGNRIFAPKAGEVIDFLAAFGLNLAEAEEVVRSVATSS